MFFDPVYLIKRFSFTGKPVPKKAFQDKPGVRKFQGASDL